MKDYKMELWPVPIKIKRNKEWLNMELESAQTCYFTMENETGGLIVKGELIGESEILYFDDLKFKGIIALLHSIDKQNFISSGKNDLFDQYISEIEETLYGMKKFNKFQGKTI
ncbi:hypothetical protein R4Z09_15325 [Niallia oryzisoli]|uniref:Uncharacterized protein n=1 Tax=Niallia oryzisoli TaxID=1737571 RepID=A0ABZ2CKC9_9BACI